MERLLLVDGSNLLFQMFYGMPSRIINKDGKAIQGTLGFVGALLKLIRKVEPSHVAVFFDGEHENERTSLDEEYKANRPDYSKLPEEETPFSQMPDVYRALDYMGIKHMETLDCETDDLIAGYAFEYGTDTDIVICSFDSDFFQLITEKVTILRYRGENSILCNTEYIKEKFGITPGQYADFKSLTGDTADNIKGAPKVGPKTAAMLVNQFGDLEGVLRNAEQISKPSVRVSVQGHAEALRRNYELIKLKRRSHLPYEMDAIKYNYNGITTSEVLAQIGLR